MIFLASLEKQNLLANDNTVCWIFKGISLPTPDVPKIISYKIQGVITTSALIKGQLRKKKNLIDTTHESKQFCTQPQKGHVSKHLTLLYFWEVWMCISHLEHDLMQLILEWIRNVSYRLLRLNLRFLVGCGAGCGICTKWDLAGGGHYWEWVSFWIIAWLRSTLLTLLYQQHVRNCLEGLTFPGFDM